MISLIIEHMIGLTDAVFLGRVGDVAPVSYTHLDVYKRQGMPCLSHSQE